MEFKYILEAILFSAQKPLSIRDMRELLAHTAEENEDETVKVFKKAKEDEIVQALELLQQEHVLANRSFRLSCVAGAWQFVSEAQYAPWLMVMVGQKVRPPRLSSPALETLAIVAYRQPVTRAEIEQVRGVAVDGVMQTLVERGLLEQVGRAEVIGRPMQYGTTSLFLEYFGLKNLEELPSADELRKIPVKRPELLQTVGDPVASESTTPPEAAPSVAEEVKGEASAEAPVAVAAEGTETNGEEESSFPKAANET
ncbi:MAG: hypothetical protein JWN25_1772 [Verrucomicrobiales bacterium]|nr:hypothetical protein [Verrucomicrobiales bacterium]